MHGATWDAGRVKRRLVEAFRSIRGQAIEATAGRLIAADSRPIAGLRLIEFATWVLDQHGIGAEWGRALLTYARLRADGTDVREFCLEKGTGSSKTKFYRDADKGAACLAAWLNCRAVLREIDGGGPLVVGTQKRSPPAA